MIEDGNQGDDIELRILLEDAIKKLPPKQQVVVALREAGYSQMECGVIIGMTRAAVGFIQKKSLFNLRGILNNGGIYGST